MSGSWGCPHELNDLCTKAKNLPCDPGMKGCVLHGRFVFADDTKNEPLRKARARRARPGASLDAGAGDDSGG